MILFLSPVRAFVVRLWRDGSQMQGRVQLGVSTALGLTNIRFILHLDSS